MAGKRNKQLVALVQSKLGGAGDGNHHTSTEAFRIRIMTSKEEATGGRDVCPCIMFSG
jgi:hypothetical protein